MRNVEIAEAFEELASLYELDGAVVYRVLAYRNAAKAIREGVVAALRAHPAAKRVELAGSARRMTDTCKDLDVVAASDDPRALAEAFQALPEVEAVHSSGEAGARGGTPAGRPPA